MSQNRDEKKDILKKKMQSGYWNDVLTTLKKEAAFAKDSEDGHRIYSEIASIYLNQFHNLEEAKRYFLEGSKLNNHYFPILQGLEKIALETVDAELFKRTYTHFEESYLNEQDGINKDTLFNFYFRFGRNWRLVFNDYLESSVCLARAYELRPEHEQTFELLSSDYEDLKEWQKQEQLYKERIGEIPISSSRSFRVKHFFVLFYKLNRPDEAINTLSPILEERPKDTHVLLLLARAYQRIKDWPKLATSLLRLATLSEDPDLRKSYLLQAAEILHVKCGQYEDATKALDSVLESEPSNTNALERLMQIARFQGNASGQIRALEKLYVLDLETKRLDDAVARVVELAKLYQTQDGGSSKAVEALQQVLAHKSDSLPIITLLSRLYRENGDWSKLIDVYKSELSATKDDAHQQSLYYRIGEILEGPLKNPEAAIQIYENALNVSPIYLPINQRLAGLYVEHGMWDKLANLYSNELEHVENDRRAATLLENLATLYQDRLQDNAKAEQYFERLLQVVPDNLVAISALSRLYQQEEKWQKLVELNLREAELCSDPKKAISLYYRTGLLCEEKLGHRDMAVMCYQNVLSISPTYIPALRSLGNAYAEQENWGGLIAMYQRESQVTSDNEKQLHLLTRIAEIYWHLCKDLPKAVETLNSTLQIDPNYSPAIRQLESIYEREGKNEELAALYRNLLQHAETEESNLGMYHLKLAKLLNLELGKTDESERHYLAAIEYGFGFNTALNSLDQIFTNSNRFEELKNLFENVLQKVSEPTHLFSLLHRLGTIEIDYLDDFDAGINNLMQAYAIDKEHEPLLWDLVRHLETHNHWNKLAKIFEEQAALPSNQGARDEFLRRSMAAYRRAEQSVEAANIAQIILNGNAEDAETTQELIKIYESSHQFEKCPPLYRQLIALARENSDKIKAHMSLAQLYDEVLDEPEEAIKQLEASLRLDPDERYQVLALLEKLNLKLKNWNALKSLYPQLLEHIRDQETLIKLKLRQGEACERLEQDQEALEVYRDALDLDNHNASLRTRIVEVLTRLEAWQELLSFLKESGELSPEDPKPYEHMGLIAEEKLGAQQDAMEYHREAIRRDEHFLPSYEKLSGLCLANQVHQEFLDLTAIELTKTKKDARKRWLFLHRGRVLRDFMKNGEAAVLEFQYGLKLNIEPREFHEELAHALKALEKWQEAISAFEGIVSTLGVSAESDATVKEDAAKLYFEMGEIAQSGLNDEEQCILFNEKAIEIAPYFEPSLEKLKAIYERNGSWNKVVQVYQKSISALQGKSPEKLIGLHISLGMIFEQNLQNDTKAMQEFSKALRYDKNCIPAHVGLARLYGKHKEHYNKAVTENLFLLGYDAMDPARFKEIARIYEETDRYDHLCRVYEAMDLLGILSAEDREVYNQYAVKVPKEPKGTLENAIFVRFVLHHHERQPLYEFLVEILEDFGDFCPVTRESLGVTKKDRVNPKDQHRLREPFDQCCQYLGLENVELYVKKQLSKPVECVFNGSPALVLDDNWAKSWNRPQMMFFLGSHLSRFVNNRGVLAQLDSYGVERLIRLVLFPYLRDKPALNEDIETELKRIKKVTRRKTKKFIEENGERAVGKLESTNFTDWVDGIQKTSARIGALVSSRLSESVYGLKEIDPKIAEGNLWQSPLARELILFVCSDDGGQARKASGTSIYAV